MNFIHDEPACTSCYLRFQMMNKGNDREGFFHDASEDVEGHIQSESSNVQSGSRLIKLKKMKNFVIRGDGDKPEMCGNPKKSPTPTVGRIKRKAPNGDTAKRKKPNIVESFVVSLNDESKCQDSPSAPKEEVNEDFNQSITSTNRASKHPPPDLPPGWCRKEVNKPFAKHELIVIVQAPDGKQFDTQKKLNSYLARNKMQLKLCIDGPNVNRITFEEDEIKEVKKKVKIKSKKVKVKSKKVKSKIEETAVTDRNLTNDDIDEDYDKEFSHQYHSYIKEINVFMAENDLNLKAFPLTKGDGNCWFRAVAYQIVIQNIPDKARNHRALRLEVCDHVNKLQEDIIERTIDNLFNGKERGLSELVARQRRAGQWVDNNGIMVMATALYLGRNIHLYSYPSETGDNAYSLTSQDGGPGADDYPPVTVFFYDKHYQVLQPDNTS